MAQLYMGVRFIEPQYICPCRQVICNACALMICNFCEIDDMQDSVLMICNASLRFALIVVCDLQRNFICRCPKSLPCVRVGGRRTPDGVVVIKHKQHILFTVR